MRGGGSLKAPTSRFLGYTLAEIIIVMLIIAVVVAVTIGITKAKLDNIVSYTYYNAYSTLRKISTEMLADWDPQDPEYKQALNNEIFRIADKNMDYIVKSKLSHFKSDILTLYENLFSPSLLAAEPKCYVAGGATREQCQYNGGIGVQFQERNFIIPVFRTAATVPEICQVLILVVILVHPGIC